MAEKYKDTNYKLSVTALQSHLEGIFRDAGRADQLLLVGVEPQHSREDVLVVLDKVLVPVGPVKLLQTVRS